MGPKPLELINGDNRIISQYYRYKVMLKAVTRAIQLPNPRIIIWNREVGKRVAVIRKTRKTIKVELI